MKRPFCTTPSISSMLLRLKILDREISSAIPGDGNPFPSRPRVPRFLSRAQTLHSEALQISLGTRLRPSSFFFNGRYDSALHKTPEKAANHRITYSLPKAIFRLIEVPDLGQYASKGAMLLSDSALPNRPVFVIASRPQDMGLVFSWVTILAMHRTQYEGSSTPQILMPRSNPSTPWT